MSDGCFAVILAAGQSSRMGSDKATLPWLNGEPLLLWMNRELGAAGWTSIAVVAPEQFEFWNGQLPERCAVVNPDPSRGKTSSITCGVAAIPSSARWILITAVDQPRPPSVYKELRLATDYCNADILVPALDGHRGHPAVISVLLRSRLTTLEEESQGLRGLMNEHADRTLRVPVEEYRDWDLNTPDSYRQALAEITGVRPERIN